MAFEARFTESGSLQLDGSVSSPAADLAEYYPVAGDVEPGDVVAFADRGLALERARSSVGPRLAGVVSSRPAFAMGLSYSLESETGVPPEAFGAQESADAVRSEDVPDPAVVHEIEVNRRAPLALSGRVPCKVSAENGPIRPGDLLTVASVPGHAAKATTAGPVVGTALEAHEWGEGRILVLANLGWFSPTDELERHVAEIEARLQRLEGR